MYEVAISHHITPKLSVFLGKNNRNNDNNYNMFKCMGERKRMKEQQEHLLCYIWKLPLYSKAYRCPSVKS